MADPYQHPTHEPLLQAQCPSGSPCPTGEEGVEQVRGQGRNQWGRGLQGHLGLLPSLGHKGSPKGQLKQL